MMKAKSRKLPPHFNIKKKFGCEYTIQEKSIASRSILASSVTPCNSGKSYSILKNHMSFIISIKFPFFIAQPQLSSYKRSGVILINVNPLLFKNGEKMDFSTTRIKKKNGSCATLQLYSFRSYNILKSNDAKIVEIDEICRGCVCLHITSKQIELESPMSQMKDDFKTFPTVIYFWMIHHSYVEI